jgi:Zn-dependent protease
MSGWGLLAIALAGPAVNIALALMLGGVVYLIWGTSQVVILSVPTGRSSAAGCCRRSRRTRISYLRGN